MGTTIAICIATRWYQWMKQQAKGSLSTPFGNSSVRGSGSSTIRFGLSRSLMCGSQRGDGGTSPCWPVRTLPFPQDP